MKLINKKLLAASVISATAISAAHAADVDIDASAVFRSAVAFANATAMDFGTIDVTGSAGAATILLDVADASLTASDTANYTPGATGTLGSVEVSGEVGATVNISCEVGGTLANAAGDDTIDMINTEIQYNGANETSCAGVGTSPLAVALTAGTDTITLGGTLNLTGAPNAEEYSTTNTNGVPTQITAVFN